MAVTKRPVVSPPDPTARFIGVSAPRPAPKRLPNVEIHRRVRRLCDDVPMVVGPAPDHGVEQSNPGFLLRRSVRPDGLSDVIQKRLHVPGRRLDQQLAVVFAYILSEKVEAFRDVRDFGLFLRELKTPCDEESLDARFDFTLQQFLRAAGNNKVVRISPSRLSEADEFARFGQLKWETERESVWLIPD